MSTEQPQEQPVTNKLVHLTVVSTGFEDIVFKVKTSTKFQKILEKYCQRFSIETQNSVSFIHEGEKVDLEKTPEDLNLGDKDSIEAVMNQVGGCTDENLG